MKENIPERLLDPINYMEACYWIEQKNLYCTEREHIQSLNAFEALQWLGSNCGQWYLERVNELIEEYPFKYECYNVIVMGKIINPRAHIKHREWIESKLLS